MAYSLYALYACGKDAVFGGTLVLVIGYLLYGSLAKRFVGISNRSDPSRQPLTVDFRTAQTSEFGNQDMNVKSTKTNKLLLVCLLTLVPVLANANTLERVRASNTFTLGYLPDFATF